MAKQKSMKGKGSYASYKSESRAYTNRVKKFERIVKENPNDEEAAKTLKKLKDGGSAKFKFKSRPKVPGSNKTVSKKYRAPTITMETAGEQLSRLLGIPLPKVSERKSRTRAAVVVKKRKNVEKSETVS